MMQLRKSNDRGLGDHGWLKSRHSFSFADYHDPAHMGFRSLRVINEDFIAAGRGFGAHPHRDMEIISYVAKGAIEHQDSMGNKAVVRPGEVQYMSAGTGVVHQEYNPLGDEETHLFQIWILPRQRGGTPTYGQKSFEAEIDKKDFVLVVSPEGRDGSIAIRQDADVYVSRLKAKASSEFKPKADRGVWIQVVKGALAVNGQELVTGDALAVTDETSLKFTASADSELFVFDLA